MSQGLNPATGTALPFGDHVEYLLRQTESPCMRSFSPPPVPPNSP